MSYVDHLRAALAEPDWILLQRLADIAARAGMSLYIVGGPVRDCLLRRAVTDLDLTTEGDALTLARTMARELGGAWKKFDRFGTAKLILPGAAAQSIWRPPARRPMPIPEHCPMSPAARSRPISFAAISRSTPWRSGWTANSRAR